MTISTAPLRIDIVSDIMCPWCLIGYRQLASALKMKGVAHEIHWHPFELNPEMPPEGQNIREHLSEKYGSSPEESAKNREHLAGLGEALGFEFKFADNSRMHNTFNTHQLLHWAETLGRKHELKQALFAAHFTEGRNLSDDEVLADIAAENGFERIEARAVLEDQRYAAEVRQVEKFWIDQGIRGVPAVVFERQHLVTGAQGVENYSDILDQLMTLQKQADANDPAT